MPTSPKPKPRNFTLRFHDSVTHDLLGVVAEGLGVSKNRLAEQMLERELSAAALFLERDLTGTLERLQSYRRDDRLEADIQAFAEGEAFGDDPLRSRRVEQGALDDSHGVIGIFSS
jgi:hypothetical protein